MKVDVVTSRTAGYKSDFSAEISICKTVISTILRVVNASGNGEWQVDTCIALLSYIYLFRKMLINIVYIRCNKNK